MRGRHRGRSSEGGRNRRGRHAVEDAKDAVGSELPDGVFDIEVGRRLSGACCGAATASASRVRALGALHQRRDARCSHRWANSHNSRSTGCGPARRTLHELQCKQCTLFGAERRQTMARVTPGLPAVRPAAVAVGLELDGRFTKSALVIVSLLLGDCIALRGLNTEAPPAGLGSGGIFVKPAWVAG